MGRLLCNINTPRGVYAHIQELDWDSAQDRAEREDYCLCAQMWYQHPREEYNPYELERINRWAVNLPAALLEAGRTPTDEEDRALQYYRAGRYSRCVHSKDPVLPAPQTMSVAVWPPEVSAIMGAYGQQISTGSASSILKGIRDGKWRNHVAAVRKLTGDEKNAVKSKLPAIMWSGSFSCRGAAGLIKHSGLVCVDLDHVNNPAIVIDKLSRSPHVVASFISPSGDGVKTLVDCRGYDGSTHRLAYVKAIALVREITGIESDNTPDVCRLCFVSYDSDLVVKWDTTPLPPPTPQEIIASQEAGAHKETDCIKARMANESTAYGFKALEDECQKVSVTAQGQRNKTLFSAAARIGELVAGGEIAEQDAVAALEDAGTACGLDKAEAAAATANGMVRGKANPRGAQQEIKFIMPDAADDVVPAADSPNDSRSSVGEVNPETPSADVSLTPWRDVTTGEIRNIVMPTALGPIVEALQAATVPPLPLETTLVKAMVLAGCALSGPNLAKYDPALPTFDKWCNGDGVDLARVKIETAGGQIPNVYGLIVCPSGTGKDIGQVIGKLARRNKWWIGSGGSKEGIQDAFKSRPNGLILVSEMRKWLDKDSWQAKAKEFLTEAFNFGCYSEPRSEKSKESRDSPYIYPNVFAAVQPDTISRLARSEDIDNGFLGRFLFGVYEPPADEQIPIPTVENMETVIETADQALGRYLSVAGSFRVPKEYPKRLLQAFFRGRAGFESHFRRLALEYLPRIALMLSVPRDPKTNEGDVFDNEFNLGQVVLRTEISQDALDAAERVVMWFYAQAEGVLDLVREDERTAIRERAMRTIARHVRKMRGAATKTTIARNCHRECPSGEDRRKDIIELCERGILTTNGKNYCVAKMPPGW